MPVNSWVIATVFPSYGERPWQRPGEGRFLGTNLPCGQPHGWAGCVDPVARVVGTRESRQRTVLDRVGAAPPGVNGRLRAGREHDTEARPGADLGAVERIGAVADRDPCAAAIRENLIVLPRIREAAPLDRLVAPRSRVWRNRDVEPAGAGWRGRRGRRGRRCWCGRCGVPLQELVRVRWRAMVRWVRAPRFHTRRRPERQPKRTSGHKYVFL